MAEYVAALRSRVGRSKHAARVALHGLVPMEQLIADNDLILMPSIDESMPQTMLLALAAGLPAVACPCGGIPDLIRHGETGYLAEGFSAEAIAAALKEALDDRAHWPDRAARAQAILTHDYTEPIVVNRLLSAMVRGAEIGPRPERGPGRRTADRTGVVPDATPAALPEPVPVRETRCSCNSCPARTRAMRGRVTPCRARGRACAACSFAWALTRRVCSPERQPCEFSGQPAAP